MNRKVKYTNKNSFNRKFGTGFPPSYPNEMLVKFLSSSAYSGLDKNTLNKKEIKILEIGCSSGNNLRFFLEKKYKTYGLEINKQMVDLGKINLKRLGYRPPPIYIGDNLNIPFKDNFFDCLVSINTIHYNSGKDLFLALSEFVRVLKKKTGFAIIETVGNKHFAFQNGKKISQYKYKSGIKDFRKNKIFGYFSTKNEFKNFLNKFFRKVEVYERVEFSKIKLHFLIAVCYF